MMSRSVITVEFLTVFCTGFPPLTALTACTGFRDHHSALFSLGMSQRRIRRGQWQPQIPEQPSAMQDPTAQYLLSAVQYFLSAFDKFGGCGHEQP